MRTAIKSRSENKGGLFNGVMLLTVSTLICKIIGLLFKIPIIGIVGIDGMAYFSAAYNIYMLLNSISAAGLPVALSILVSKNISVGRTANAKRIFSISMAVFASLGIISTISLYLCADIYSQFIGISAASPAVKAIAPTLLFICLSGGIRGYFQGFKLMTPTAISQLLESLGKLVLGISFALLVIRKGADSSLAASAAVSGLSVGVMISLIYLSVRLTIFQKTSVNVSIDSSKDRIGRITRDLFYIAFPITLSSCITSLTSIADTALITNRLISGGLSNDAAVTLYSSYINLAIPLFNLPPALITPIAVSLVPALTSSVTKRNSVLSERFFSSSVRMCNILAIPAALGLAVFAKPILLLIYPGEKEACAFAAPLLSVLSIAIIFSCLITVLNAVLQAYMKPVLPIIAMGMGAVVKIISEYVFVGSKLGVMGAPISTVACTLTIFIVDLIFVIIYTPHKISYKPIFKSMFAAIASVTVSALVYYLLIYFAFDGKIVLMISILLTIFLYSLLALTMGLVDKTDILRLPLGSRLVGFLQKIKLMKE